MLGSSLTPCQLSTALRGPEQAGSRALREEDAFWYPPLVGLSHSAVNNFPPRSPRFGIPLFALSGVFSPPSSSKLGAPVASLTPRAAGGGLGVLRRGQDPKPPAMGVGLGVSHPFLLRALWVRWLAAVPRHLLPLTISPWGGCDAGTEGGSGWCHPSPCLGAGRSQGPSSPHCPRCPPNNVPMGMGAWGRPWSGVTWLQLVARGGQITGPPPRGLISSGTSAFASLELPKCQQRGLGCP